MGDLELIDPDQELEEIKRGTGRPPGGPYRPRPDKVKSDILDINLGLAQDEIYRRLKDPAIARELPFHALVTYVVQASRIKQADEKTGDPAAKAQTFNVLQIVQRDGLPPERQRELILAAIDTARELGEPVGPFQQALKQLEATSGP